jgi:hypothetical protein
MSQHTRDIQMKRFVQGEDRTQGTLLPKLLDDYVAADNPVRVIEVFVDELDLGELGFQGVDPQATGRPAYHPATLLKIYIYGYLNRIQSSRRLERETQRNVELELSLPGLPDQGPMHHWQRAANQTLGARRGTRCHASAAGPRPRENAGASTNRRTSVRNNQVLDGVDAFPDQDAGSGQYRDESSCARLQPEASDANIGRRPIAGGDEDGP